MSFVTLPPIDCHVHSKYSPDSESELEDIAKTALSREIAQVAVVDHLYSPEHLPRLFSRPANQKIYGVTLLMGVELSLETNIAIKALETGGAEKWGPVSGAVHGFAPWKLYPAFNEQGYSEPAFGASCRAAGLTLLLEYYVDVSTRAMRTGAMDILTHPFDIFIYGSLFSNLFIAAAEELAFTAAFCGVAVELNEHIMRLIGNSETADSAKWRGIYQRLALSVIARGGRLVMGSDAHHARDVGDVRCATMFVKDLGVPLASLEEKLKG
ncbi:MAG: PHP domain-containing protein [Nitrospinae bacterium]|nr:PHP domain-containing protein [Nitrospinota bacterium]